MNCKPGDLALVVRPCVAKLIATGEVRHFPPAGTPVRVVRLLPGDEMGPHWELADLISWSVQFSDGSRASGDLFSIADAFLRPIRDPGDDATDETLQWLPVPSEKEPA